VVLISVTDITFWGVLGLLLKINTWYEAKYSRQRAKMKMDRSLAAAFKLGLKTSATMAVVLVLWSMWMTDSIRLWLDIMKKGLNCSFADLGWIALGLSVPGVVAALLLLATREKPKFAGCSGATRRCC
jgi:hypothetical protein